MRICIALDFSNIVFVDLFKSLFCLHHKRHSFSQFRLSLIFNCFDLNCLLISFLRLTHHFFFYDICISLFLCQSFQKFLSFNTLLFKFGLHLRHLYFQFCNDIVCRVELLQSFCKNLSTCINLSVLECKNCVEESKLI